MSIGSATHGTSCDRSAAHRALTITTIISAMSVGAPALAIDPIHSPKITKHQMIVQMASCMKTRMSASKTLWYNDAVKACRDQIDRQRANATSDALLASDAAEKK